MNLADAALVLDTLAAPYPRWDLDDRALKAWGHAIANSGAAKDVALGQAEAWGRTNTHPPSLAEFLARIRPPAPPVTDPDAPIRTNAAVVRRIRATLAAATQAIEQRVGPAARQDHGGHDHRGPNPCPVCGGHTSARAALHRQAAS